MAGLDRNSASRYAEAAVRSGTFFFRGVVVAQKKAMGAVSMVGNAVRASKFVLQVVEQQLEADTPPETRQTFARLQKLGFSDEDAKHLIGAAMAVEVRAVVAESRTFDPERYCALLQELPNLPD
jgi:hypothetical protein